jgi:hypothetical protein
MPRKSPQAGTGKKLKDFNYSAVTKAKFVGVMPTEPDWLRLPPDGVTEPWSTLQRGKMKQLVELKLVDSIKLPNEGDNKKGVVLVRWTGPRGLRAYLERLQREQNSQAA